MLDIALSSFAAWLSTPVREPLSTVSRCLLVGPVCLALGAPSMAQDPVPPPATDPFVPGLRWAHAAEPQAPWIPRDVCFVGAGELVWAAPAVQNPGLRLLSADEVGLGMVLQQDDGLAGAIGEVRVAAGDTASKLFAAAQYPAPTAALRQTLVTRHDAEAAAQGLPFTARWTHDLGLRANGPARLVANPDGSVLLVAALDATNQVVQIDRLEPLSGALLATSTRSATGLSDLALSADGRLVAVAAGTHLWVLDELGQTVWQRTVAAGVGALALSADGALLAYVTGSRLEVLELVAGSYAPVFGSDAASTEVGLHVRLSEDGVTVATSWWDFTTGNGVRAEVFDVPSQLRVNEYTQSGASGVQNFPASLELAADGSRVALALWGASDARAELVLLDRTDPEPLLSADLPGSALASALDRSGTRVVVAAKDTHANAFSSTGALRLYDTAERDLQLLAAARPGGSVDLAYAMPEDGLALFAAGFELARPGQFKGQVLWIDWSLPHFVFAGVVGAAGARRANVSVPLAPDASLVGLPLAVQAATLGASGVTLSSSRVRPRVL